jgi:hypothetical protein
MTRRSSAAPAPAPTIPNIPPTQVLSRLSLWAPGRPGTPGRTRISRPVGCPAARPARAVGNRGTTWTSGRCPDGAQWAARKDPETPSARWRPSGGNWRISAEKMERRWEPGTEILWPSWCSGASGRPPSRAAAGDCGVRPGEAFQRAASRQLATFADAKAFSAHEVCSHHAPQPRSAGPSSHCCRAPSWSPPPPLADLRGARDTGDGREADGLAAA